MLADLTVKDFLAQTASDAPVPGGGSVSALCGATACALIEMVAGLTVGKKGYEEQTEAMTALMSEMSAKREELLRAIDEDAQSFNQVMACFKMPKSTDEEKKARSGAIQEATKQAALVPLSVAEKTFAILDLAGQVIQHGNQNALSDGAVAAMLCRTAVLGALYNVKINLGSIKDEAFRIEVGEKVDRLEREVCKKEQEILSYVKL